MSNNALTHASAAYGAKNRQPDRGQAPPATGPARHRANAGRAQGAGSTLRALTGLLTFAGTLVTASAVLGVRTWHVGSGLGSALFPVEDIVELAAVASGTVVAGWSGLHALIALACVIAARRGRRWAAGEHAVARHAPAMVRRLARAAAGAGLGLALATPTAMALPGHGPGALTSAGDDRVAVLDLGWQPTQVAADKGPAADIAPDRSAASRPRSAPERSALVNRGLRTGTVREPLIVVEPGDTLWAIAADRLADERTGGERTDDGPTRAERAGAAQSDTAIAEAAIANTAIAEAVTRWHDANRRVLGSNPDLIRPGMVLRQP
ncbi:hypothetical protein [Promicromonospora sp. NPDC023987]|uniref:hypothetical protein n=1 Tax=Promicromonospora sp. NPDC023987 TaxID=3155360 RepID=UPI0033E72BF8